MSKVFFFATLLTSLTLSVVSQASPYLFEGFSNVDEYRLTIDLKTGVGDFFDNDTVSDLRVVKARLLERMPPQMRYL